MGNEPQKHSEVAKRSRKAEGGPCLLSQNKNGKFGNKSILRRFAVTTDTLTNQGGVATRPVDEGCFAPTVAKQSLLDDACWVIDSRQPKQGRQQLTSCSSGARHCARVRLAAAEEYLLPGSRETPMKAPLNGMDVREWPLQLKQEPEQSYRYLRQQRTVIADRIGRRGSLDSRRSAAFHSAGVWQTQHERQVGSKSWVHGSFRYYQVLELVCTRRDLLLLLLDFLLSQAVAGLGKPNAALS